MKRSALTRPTDLPSAEARIPALAVRGAIVLLGALLALADFGPGAWFAVGCVLSLAAGVWTPYLLGWGLILFLAAGRLAHHAALSWQFLVLLAGVHLLHVLATFALGLPLGSWIEPAVFRAPLRRFLIIQIPTQLLAVVALLLLAPGHTGHRPLTVAGFAVVGVLALAGLLLMGAQAARSA